MSAADKYREALASAPADGDGRTHSWMMGTANLAALAGVDSGTAERDMADALGPRGRMRSVELRATVAKAYRERGERYEPPRETWQERVIRAKTEAKGRRMERQSFIDFFAGRAAGLGEADLWEASPVHPSWEPEKEGWKDAWTLLRAMFRPGELVACGTKTRKSVRTCAEWCKAFRDGEPIPPLVIANPIKAEGGTTKDGMASMFCDDAVAAHRQCLIEFDNVPVETQIRFWLGFGLEDVRAMVFSGNKSVHAVLRIGAKDKREWDATVGSIYKRFGLADADRACMNPSRGVRLAGAVREDTGRVQKLLFAGLPL